MTAPKKKTQIVRPENEIGELLAWAEEGAKDGLAFECGVLSAVRWLTGRSDDRPDQAKASDVEPEESKDADDPDEEDFA